MKLNDIKQIVNKMEKIRYGYLDKNNKNIFDCANVEDLFDKEYCLMSPDELLIKKVGVCWDQVELERKLFADNNIKHETYFICINDHENFPSHTFLVFYDKENVYWFENSWFDEKGIHKYSSFSELLNDVVIKFVNSRKNEIKENLDVVVYKYDKPNYNISCREFYDYINTQKIILTSKIIDIL